MRQLFTISLLSTLILCSCGDGKQQTSAQNDDAEKEQTVGLTNENAQETPDEQMVAPDFTLNDLEGNPLSLQSLRGKFVVLDFWGSWCGWCIKGIPDMKECYNKYSDKLEIVGIDCGDSEEAWKEAVNKYEMPWKHVYNSETDRVNELYLVEGFPTKIIIDPQGNIIREYVGEDPEFYTFIDEIMK